MTVYGREIGFRRTVAATINLAKICPDGKLEKIDELFKGRGSDGKVMEYIAKIIEILNRADEEAKHFENPEYKVRPLTVEEILSLDMEDFRALESEAIKAFVKDANTTVKLAEAKKNDPVNQPEK